jgi:hypothetical protein
LVPCTSAPLFFSCPHLSDQFASVTIFSIIRVKALITLGTSDNFTWDNYPVTLWSTLEINCGVICICLPTLRLLLIRLFPALGGGSQGYGDAYKRTGGTGSGNVLSTMARMAQGRVGKGRAAEDSDSTLKLDGAPPSSSAVSTTPTAQLASHGIIREQTYVVQYDDDEASLVHMRALDGNKGRIHQGGV